MDNEQRETLAELIELFGITAESHGGVISINPTFPGAREYTVTLRREGNECAWLTTPYYMGSALAGEPTALDVLSSLLMDAEGYDEYGVFESWANEHGYDEDSCKAYAIYERIAEARDDLYAWLSNDLRIGSTRYDGRHYARFMAAERD